MDARFASGRGRSRGRRRRRAQRARLDALSKSAVITVADAPERLADQAALFLHRAEATLPAPTRKLLHVRDGSAPLQGRKALVIDDDIRNVFALDTGVGIPDDKLNLIFERSNRPTGPRPVNTAAPAQAMTGDREKALAAGASDYISKPVDVDELVSMMRAWLDV